MDFFDMISAYVNMIWYSVSVVPLFNTGITFGQFFIGFIGLSVIGFCFRVFFGLAGLTNFTAAFNRSIDYLSGNRSRSEKISEARRNDER